VHVGQTRRFEFSCALQTTVFYAAGDATYSSFAEIHSHRKHVVMHTILALHARCSKK